MGHFNYEQQEQEALRSIIRGVLQDVARNGLHAPNYFYITFLPHYPGVVIPDFLQNHSQEEMTIVLQHQFRDLYVTEKDFSVTLSFDQQSHGISVPFAALLNFTDPGEDFTRQFTPPPPDDDNNTSGGKVIALDIFRKKKK